MRGITCIAILTGALGSHAKAQDHDPSLAELAFMVGRWSLALEDRQPNGSIRRSRGTSEVRLVLDGRALQDDFRALDAAGRVVFRGTSFRAPNPRTGGWSIKWMMVGDPGYTIIEAVFDSAGRTLTGTGRGEDLAGRFEERFVYRFHGADRYEFDMDRTYDGGKSWIVGFSRIEAERLR
ncbi:MAG: DUF1579 family protein [Gemmatimonadales bacterium]